MASLPEGKISSSAPILTFSGLKIAVTYSVMGQLSENGSVQVKD